MSTGDLYRITNRLCWTFESQGEEISTAVLIIVTLLEIPNTKLPLPGTELFDLVFLLTAIGESGRL